MQVLIIEDNHDIGQNISKFLTAKSIHNTLTATSSGAKFLLEKQKYDIVILDRMLPDEDGIHLCDFIKTTYPHTAIIMSTARAQIDDKTNAFAKGVDDYLVKPFDLEELVMRLYAIYHRYKSTSNNHTTKNNIYIYQNIQIDLNSRNIYMQDKLTDISLSNTERNIFQYIYQAGGNIVSRNSILEYIWGSQAMRGDDNKLDVYISTIRKKLHKDIIITEKGFGYKINRQN